MAFTDADGVIVWVNPAFTRLTGYASGEVIGQPLLKPGAHAPSLYRDLWDTVRSGLPWSGDMINRRKDGSTYVEEQTVTPVLDTHGAIPHFIAIKQDVTQRRRLQEEMRTSELRFRRLFETAQDGILLLTAETGEITDVNPFLTEILGYSRAEFLGRGYGKSVRSRIPRPADRRSSTCRTRAISVTRTYRWKLAPESSSTWSSSATCIGSTTRE
jgi:PAS domain S-box-containing protein